MLRPMRAAFDVLVLTVANQGQRAYAQLELEWRERRGLLPPGLTWMVQADPRGARVGSGGSTLLALAALAHAWRGAWGKHRALILHSGGDSRRLPAYSARGKIWCPLPSGTREPGDRPALFDLVLEELLELPPLPRGGVVVASGDAALRLRFAHLRMPARGAAVVAFPAPHERAVRHGVFVADRRGRLTGALQKPTLHAAQEAAAVAADGMLLVDSGVLACAPDACAALLRAGGANPRTGAAPRGTLLAAVRAGKGALDLYTHIPQAMAAGTTLAAFTRAHHGSGPTPAQLATLHRALHAVPCAVERLPAGMFLHVGSTAEYVQELTSPAVVRRFPEFLPERAPSARTFRLRAVDGAPAVVARAPLAAHQALAAIPVGQHAWCVVPHTTADDCKTTADQGGTVHGTPLATLPARTGLTPRALWSDNPRTLWFARIFPVGRAAACFSATRWLRTGGRAPAAWRAMERVSLAELMHRASPERQFMASVQDAAHASARLMAHEAHQRATVDPLDAACLLASAARELAMAPDAPAHRSHMTRLEHQAVHLVGSVVPRPSWAAPMQRFAVRQDQAVWASAPVRIDLAGGWTDTPPLCMDHGGCVVNAAITLNGTHPVQAMVKVVPDPTITIHSVDLGATTVLRTQRQLRSKWDPTDWTTLARAALHLSGLCPADARADLRAHLQRAGGGLAVTLFSAVPHGSGLGTSSILGATLLAALARVAGRQPSHEALIQLTSALEQQVGSRGGWQDQVGGVLPGIKLATTHAGIQQQPAAQAITLHPTARTALRDRSILLYTGYRRLARNILQTVVLRYLSGDRAVLQARSQLAEGALAMAAALQSGNVAQIATHLQGYWDLKRVVDPAACTPPLEAMVAPFQRHLAAWSMPGAGGGGFIFMLARSPASAKAIRAHLAAHPPNALARVFDFDVDNRGLAVAVL